MPLVVVAVGAGVVAGWIRGGRLRFVAGARLRSAGLLLAGALCELVGSRWASGSAGTGLLIAGYVLLIAFALRNLAVAGMILVAFGLLANLTVIAVDGGMPVRGLPAGAPGGPRHHPVRPGDHLVGLADVIHLAPIGETVSAGDMVLALGVATAVSELMRPRRRVANRSGSHAEPGPDGAPVEAER
jgi:Family of unknown function (DUF5317)